MKDYDRYLEEMREWHESEPEPENPDTGEDRLIYERLENEHKNTDNGKTNQQVSRTR